MANSTIVAMPALNEAENIEGMITAIRSSLQSDPLILVIDDGSTDDTASIAQRNGARVISHAKPLGLGHSFREIVLFALRHKAGLLVTIDADSQFDPADIPALIEPIRNGRADFVAGNRFSAETRNRPLNMPWTKYYGNICMTALVRLITGREISDASSGFRAYSSEALLQLNLHGSFTYTQETFLDLATKHARIEQVPVSVKYHSGRKSRVVRNIVHYGIRSLATILRTVRDHRPLFVFGIPAIILCLTGLGAGLFLLSHYLWTGSFSPYIFIGMSGAYLFSVGLVFGIVGIASDMLRPMRRNQEALLYFMKKREYYGDDSTSGHCHATRDSERDRSPGT